MGTSYFNPQSSGAATNGALLYRMKPLPVTTQLYGQQSVYDAPLPVYRSGAGQSSFKYTSSGMTLYSTNSSGDRSTTASVTYNTYLSGSVAGGYYLSTSDSCLYVLLISTTVQLIKIDDVTGGVTTIGSAFTPTTLSNWSGGYGTLYLDSGSGHLKFLQNGVYHLINKSSGALVSQNTAIVLGSFLAKDVYMTTSSGSVGFTSNYTSSTSQTLDDKYPNMVSATYGHLSGYSITLPLSGNLDDLNRDKLIRGLSLRVDTDKVAIGVFNGKSDGGSRYYMLSEFDKYLQSIADLAAGII